jgi:DNA-binding SARP family transcriptional activator
MLTDVRALLPAGGPGSNPEVRDEYQAVLGVLAHVCELTDDVDAALGWHLRLLEHDPSNEGGHLGVVTTLARVGRHEEARRRYRMYTERMRQVAREPAPYPSIA